MLRVRPYYIAISLITLAEIAAVAQSVGPGQVRQMRANGTELSYVDAGRGTPVVFAHGASTDHRFWEPQRSAFAQTHRFISVTYRYHGTAPWPDDGADYSIETHAADLAAFIAGLKAGPVHLVGLSYGGALAAMVALKEPQLIRTLTLAEPGLFSLLAEDPGGGAALQAWDTGFTPIADAIKAGELERATRHLFALVTGRAPEDFEKAPAGLRQNLLDNARTLPLLMSTPPPNITCEMLRGIKAPTLVVRGERTPAFFTKVNDITSTCIAGSTSVVVPDASHPMSYDNPRAFNHEVLAFLAKHTAS